jgi:hypothetical protein
MLYINTLQFFSKRSDGRAYEFRLGLLPVLIAYVARITSLSLETSAYFLNTLLFAGVCAHCAHRENPVLLGRLVRLRGRADPSRIYAQRNEIIRESDGALLPAGLACRIALAEAARFQPRLFVQGLLAIACLFRVGSRFFGALALWQFSRIPLAPAPETSVDPHILNDFDRAALLGALTLGHLEVGSRLQLCSCCKPNRCSLAKFKAIASQFGSAVLNEYSADEADSILFFGLIGTAVRKFITNDGILLIPLAFFFFKRLRHHLSTWQPQAQFFFIYALALAAFVIHHLFISARYVVFLNILTTPLIAIGLQHMFDTIPRWRAVFVLCLAITALANVVSLSNNKAYFREAGEWLAARPEISSVTYIDDSRTRYFSGSAFKSDKKGALNSQEIEEAISQGKIDYLVLYLSRRNTVRAQWANSLELEETKRFANKAGDAVLIFQRKKSP